MVTKHLAMSKCPSCKNTVEFEAVVEDVKNLDYKYYVIRCPICSTAIGVLDKHLEEMLNSHANPLELDRR